MYVQLLKTSENFDKVLIKFHEGLLHNKEYWVDSIIIFYLISAEGGKIPLPNGENHFIGILFNRNLQMHLEGSEEFLADLRKHYGR